MSPYLAFVPLAISALWQPAPADSVVWLPVYYDGFYAEPRGGPTWSPDGERVAFTYFEYAPPQYFYTRVQVFHRDGSSAQSCPVESFTNSRAAWSPLGDAILGNDGSKLQVLSPDDCSLVREIAASGWNPSWSRDGQRIVYEAWGTLEIVPAAGGEPFAVVSNAWQPDWSPDGQSLVFVREGNLWTISTDGTHERRITESGTDAWPAWSRDGSWIAFTRSDPDLQHTGVWIVGPQGGPTTRVTPEVDGEQRGRPGWSHDGMWLTYFVMDLSQDRLGIGTLRFSIPEAVQAAKWDAVKNLYRGLDRGR